MPGAGRESFATDRKRRKVRVHPSAAISFAAIMQQRAGVGDRRGLLFAGVRPAERRYPHRATPQGCCRRRRQAGVRVRPALAHSGTLSQFHPLELTAAALTVPSAGIRCPDPGTTVSLAQDADLPAGHRVAHWGGGSGPARVGWGAHRAWRPQGLLERARRATAAAELAVDRLDRWEGLGGGWAGLGRR